MSCLAAGMTKSLSRWRDTALRSRAAAIALVRTALTGRQPALIPHPLGAGMLYLTSASIGLQGEATLTVASSRPEFPTETQQDLLRVGTNQLAVAIDR